MNERSTQALYKALWMKEVCCMVIMVSSRKYSKNSLLSLECFTSSAVHKAVLLLWQFLM